MTTAKKALVIGASRGLGLGLVERLSEDGWEVTATVRDLGNVPAGLTATGATVEALEMTRLESMDALAQRLQQQRFDLLFINAGVSGPAGYNTDQASDAQIGELFVINAVAPIRLAQRLAGNVADGGAIAFMSSVLGSVAMPEGSPMALYKASKAALNSMTNTFVTELARPALTVLAMHPGWVKTDMGGEGASLDVATSTRGLVDVITGQLGKGGLQFLDYKGDKIDW
ncbi:SDR family oxidoreductase [Pseudomonas putida]|nr:SDR family oxidoreductase [Pseudomonas putida]